MLDFDFDKEVYKLIIEQLDGAVVTDEDGRYVYVGKSWENYFGITLDNVKGKFVKDVVPNTKIHEVLKTKRPIIGYPIPLPKYKEDQSFCNYIPIINNGEVVAGFIHIIFNNDTRLSKF